MESADLLKWTISSKNLLYVYIFKIISTYFDAYFLLNFSTLITIKYGIIWIELFFVFISISRQENAKVAEEQKAGMRRHEQVPPTAKPMLIDAENLQETLNGLTNMALVHEIALNKDFKLKKPERTTDENVR